MRSVGLFSGIGGLELGFRRAGIETELSCEWWEPAASTLRRHFAAEVVGDIRELAVLPTADVVTAGFPCTDLSQVGRTAGIEGEESGLVREVFRLVRETSPRWLVLENVPNMLTLHGGRAIEVITDWFEEHGWNWAYRVVDSRHMGVAQRRRRVLVVASKSEDPRTVLFADEAGAAVEHAGDAAAFGFYWTEGNRGVGWAPDAVPTLKGGSKLGIPSPPAVWVPSADLGLRIVRPDIRAAERLQGFPAGWTDHVEREGHRWKLVGNAVTVDVARWLGSRLMNPGDPVDVERTRLLRGTRWPSAAAGVGGRVEQWRLSERPLATRPARVSTVLAEHGQHPLSKKATAGFAKRLAASSLRAGGPDFHRDLHEHVSAQL